MTVKTEAELLTLLGEILRPEVIEAKTAQVLNVAAQTGLSAAALRALFAPKGN